MSVRGISRGSFELEYDGHNEDPNLGDEIDLDKRNGVRDSKAGTPQKLMRIDICRKEVDRNASLG